MYFFSVSKREGSMSSILFRLLPLIVFLVFSHQSLAKDEEIKLVVLDTYIDMHTGPGRGYPIFHVLEKGDEITLLYSKTDWIKATTAKGIEGWINKRFIDLTQGINGEKVELGIPELTDFNRRKWEIGASAGAFDNSIEVLGLNTAYRFTKNLSAELRFSQATGRFSNSQLISWGLVHQPFPEWKISPFFTLANGQIDISPNTNSTQASTKDNFFMVGTGIHYYLNHRFMARIEYNNYLTLPDQDKNGNIDEWKIGLTAFF